MAKKATKSGKAQAEAQEKKMAAQEAAQETVVEETKEDETMATATAEKKLDNIVELANETQETQAEAPKAKKFGLWQSIKATVNRHKTGIAFTGGAVVGAGGAYVGMKAYSKYQSNKGDNAEFEEL